MRSVAKGGVILASALVIASITAQAVPPGYPLRPRNTALPIVMEPDLAWSTFAGASRLDEAHGIAIDGARNVYVVGTTASTDFPVLNGLTSGNNGMSDAFVAKFSAEGSLLWCTCLGGTYDDGGNGIAADGAGNAYVTGITNSPNFPIKDAWDGEYGFGGDVFVTKLSSDGLLVWSTFLGGSGGDCGYGIAVNGAGNAYVTGVTYSGDFPASGAPGSGLNPGGDAFVAKFNDDGSLAWATCLGGDGDNLGRGIAVDGAGNAYVTGFTNSANFPVSNGWDTSYNLGGDAFVAKFTGGASPVWCTYLGGSGYDAGYGIAADEAGNAYVTGGSNSSDFPTGNGRQTTYGGGHSDAFVAGFNANGSPLWSTYLGGSGDDWGWGIAVDVADNVYVTGFTGSINLPVQDGWDATYNGGESDAFAARFRGDGSLVWSTYLGGSGDDWGRGIAVDGEGDIGAVGSTRSTNFPAQNAWNPSYSGFDWDAFAAKLTGGLQRLSVRSTPITGVAIIGTAAGETDYATLLDDGAPVSLTAPETASSGGAHFAFDHWVLDGAEQPLGEATLSFPIEGPAIVVAVYRVVCNLDVRSTPIGGLSIAGTPAGVTDYSSLRDVNSVVRLKALAAAAGGYAFIRWNLDGAQQLCGNTALRFTIKNNSTATARYKPCRTLKIAGPTTVKERSTARYVCKLYCKDGTSYTITPYAKWGENSVYTKFSSAGVLKTSAVRRNQRVRLSATYAGKTAYLYITIRNR